MTNLILLIIRFGRSSALYKMLGIAAAVGFLAELLGVQTGLLFGDYIYGSVLGAKFFDVPIMVSIMWALVMLVVWPCLPKSLQWKRIPIAGGVAVVYDLVLEHFATRYDLWSWSGSIPLSNYVGWFVVAMMIALLYQLWGLDLKRNILAMITLPLHIIFFTAALL